MTNPADYNKKQNAAGNLTWPRITNIIEFWQGGQGLVADGMFGPASLSRYLTTYGAVDQGTPSALAEQAVLVAVRELGNGEEHRNNAGEHLHRYRDFPYGDDYKRPIGDWCAFAAGYWIETAAIELSVDMPFDRRFYDRKRNRRMPVGSAKTLVKRAGKGGSFVEVPRRGDLMSFDRGRAGSPAGHVVIVETVDLQEEIIHTIEGNVGRFPAKVKRRQRNLQDPGRLVHIARY